MHECRSLSASCLPRHLHLPVRRERREAQERPLFALRVDNFSGREWALHSSARRARTRGEADQEEGPVDLPPAERVRQGRRTPAFEQSQDCEAKKGPSQKVHGWTFSTTCLRRGRQQLDFITNGAIVRLGYF